MGVLVAEGRGAMRKGKNAEPLRGQTPCTCLGRVTKQARANEHQAPARKTESAGAGNAAKFTNVLLIPNQAAVQMSAEQVCEGI